MILRKWKVFLHKKLKKNSRVDVKERQPMSLKNGFVMVINGIIRIRINRLGGEVLTTGRSLSKRLAVIRRESLSSV